jgi:hypothetical protein
MHMVSVFYDHQCNVSLITITRSNANVFLAASTLFLILNYFKFTAYITVFSSSNVESGHMAPELHGARFSKI